MKILFFDWINCLLLLLSSYSCSCTYFECVSRQIQIWIRSIYSNKQKIRNKEQNKTNKQMYILFYDVLLVFTTNTHTHICITVHWVKGYCMHTHTSWSIYHILIWNFTMWLTSFGNAMVVCSSLSLFIDLFICWKVYGLAFLLTFLCFFSSIVLITILNIRLHVGLFVSSFVYCWLEYAVFVLFSFISVHTWIWRQ